MFIAERMARLGTESAFEVLARAAALAQKGQSIINLGIGQPDFATPQNIVEAGRKALADGHHGYTPANGILPLREAVAADIHKRRGVEVNPDHVLVVPGGKPTMFFACLMFGEPGAEIMYPNPGFPIYESAIRFAGATPVPIKLHEKNGYAFDANEVLSAITPRTRLIILNSPANPTGGVVPQQELEKLAFGLQSHPDVAIMSDEIYSRMVYDNQPHHSMMIYEHLRDRLILLDGWSKTYAMTGWRIGYSVWPESLIDLATRLCINDHSCVNAATQYAAMEALTGPQGEVDTMVAAFDERRGVIVEELNSIPGFECPMPGGAFYTFPNITGTGKSSRELQDLFLEKVGVATVSGTSFGEFGEGYLRFSYANSTDNIREAVRRIKEVLG
ncbi:MAG: pyridoxal phosphate-dependent aminotransferase [Alphaproteobacteria bacterium]|jgi:aspartate aminotransferase|nr:pyridoxal phosphate-dependent aminotransferase [Alphaproteobacteria bacterium]MBT4016979.1 pyridoxal phosphate-dependent aminotransferase [Alphaproteobacteria bacterium]MBT4965269.1 pyridoxal phosphate-dependent aminotransferase [Alphaproteobacteria bacterium]MBT5918773.1 pyridoxal phosphate-dependent aminotransferase [Alphaproteobacteria bacterium]MBT6385354.1 pyridoxal phosphate-dependent aminotransferase [Alphaproteobacteria bacterium]